MLSIDRGDDKSDDDPRTIYSPTRLPQRNNRALSVVKEQGEPDQQHLDSEYRQLLQSGRQPYNTLAP